MICKEKQTFFGAKIGCQLWATNSARAQPKCSFRIHKQSDERPEARVKKESEAGERRNFFSLLIAQESYNSALHLEQTILKPEHQALLQSRVCVYVSWSQTVPSDTVCTLSTVFNHKTVQILVVPPGRIHAHCKSTNFIIHNSLLL